MSPIVFTASIISGSGRGKTIGTPTLNLDLADVPAELQEGIHACWINNVTSSGDEKWLQGAMHYGPRPVFKDSVACEIYALDTVIDEAPSAVDVRVIGYLRPVMDFPSVDELQRQIADDVVQTRAMLAKHGPPSHEEAHS